MNESLNPILKSKNIEVDQESKSFLAQLEIRKQLCLMNWQQSINRLDLDDDLIIDEQVEPIANLQLDVAVDEWNWNLGFYINAAISQLESQCRLIRRL